MTPSIKRDDYNFMRSLMGKSKCSTDESARLKTLFSLYVNPVRAMVLDHTCSPCVSELFQGMKNYVEQENLNIID